MEWRYTVTHEIFFKLQKSAFQIRSSRQTDVISQKKKTHLNNCWIVGHSFLLSDCGQFSTNIERELLDWNYVDFLLVFPRDKRVTWNAEPVIMIYYTSKDISLVHFQIFFAYFFYIKYFLNLDLYSFFF
jgi:hypothetical protein